MSLSAQCGLKIFLTTLSVLIILMVTGCTKNPTPAIHNPIALPENAEQVIGAQNQFAFRIFKEVLKKDISPSNKLISPFSIYMALGMAYNGAAGPTQKAMQKALQLEDIPLELLNSTSRELIENLPKEDSKVNMKIANSIWYKNQGFQPLTSFLKAAKDHYQAQVNSADFGDPQTVEQINDWVANATNQKIKKILEHTNPSDLMYLINATYFNGQWKYKFDAKQTKDETFYTPKGEVQVPFMFQKNTLNYARKGSLQILELPYGTGDFNMYILMPDKSISLQSFIASLNGDHFNDYLKDLHPANMRLFLPKWEYRYEVKNLRPELADLGMGPAFTKGADFSNMYPPEAGALISKVIHKAYIKVHEKGTEAAAVTAVGMETTASTPYPIIKINHPFLYLITEKSSGALLFLGTVTNPE